MIKGLSQAFSREGTPPGYAFYAKNIIINESFDEIINERGTDLLSVFDTTPVAIVGVIPFGSKLIFLYKTFLTDEISVYDEISGFTNIKVSRTDLAFDINFPIFGEAKLNSKSQLILAFSDRNTTAKYINLDSAAPSDNIKLYSLFMLSDNPLITGSILDGAGSFASGAYYITIQYVDENGAGSVYSQISNPIYVTSAPLRDAFTISAGQDSNLPTNKAIKLTLSNLDTSYKRLRLTVISKINDVVSVKKYKEFGFNTSSTEVVLTGAELTETVAIEEVLTKNAIYDKVGEIEALGDELFLADLESEAVVDFQSIANKIDVQWASKLNTNALKDIAPSEAILKNGTGQKTFMHDEVYALYVQFEKTATGRWSDWFHIPGPELTAGDRSTTISVATSIKFAGQNPKLFQLEDTCTNINNSAGVFWGKMSKWENANEVYPSDFPDLAGQNVRHHKFPSLWWMKLNVYPANAGYLTKNWDSLGLRVVTNLLSVADLASFKRIRIGYAKRSSANSTLLGYDILQLAANPEIGSNVFFTDIYTSSGGNFRIGATGGTDNDLRPTQNNATQAVRLHCPDILYSRPSVDDIYVFNIAKFRINDLNALFTAVNERGRVVWNNGGKIYSYFSNFMLTDVVSNAIPKFARLASAKYIPANVLISDAVGTLDNIANEECVFAKTGDVISGLTVSDINTGGADLRTDPAGSGAYDSPGLFEETMLQAVKVPRPNVFISYVDQTVVPVNSLFIPQAIDDISLTPILFGDGDAFICTHSFLAMAPISKGNYTAAGSNEQGIRNTKLFLLESRLNLNQRFTVQGDYNTYFYPANNSVPLTDRTEYWFAKIDLVNAPINQIKYNRDFNALNDYEQYGIYDHTKDYVTTIPFAIARSQKASRAADLDDGWRQFKPNDIFFTVRNKGRIIKLVGWGTDSLLIHHERALFKTRDKAILQTDITQISLGSGDLFALEPQEVAPSEYGYGGTQHKFACLLCEAGYGFVDADTGEVMLYGGGDKYSLINKGYKNFFRDTFRNNVVGDNPFNSTGITFAFDKRHYRLTLSLKAPENSFSISYDLIKEEWSTFHDFIPDYAFNTRKKFYSLKNNTVNVHGVGARGRYYGVTYPSFVDLIFNRDPKEEKIIGSIQWITKVTNALGAIKADETITHVTIWNDSFCTGRITLNQHTNLVEYENKNIRQTDRTWGFDEIFDTVLDPQLPFINSLANDYRPISTNITTPLAWFEREMVRGKYFIIRLEYSNFEDKLVSLRELIVNARPSSYQ